MGLYVMCSRARASVSWFVGKVQTSHGPHAHPGAVKDSPSRLRLDDLLLCLAMHAGYSIGCGHKFRVVRLPVEARDCRGRRGETLAQLRRGRTLLGWTLIPQPCPLEAVHAHPACFKKKNLESPVPKNATTGYALWFELMQQPVAE